MIVGVTLFGIWIPNALAVSASALFVSSLALVHTVSAKPSVVLTVNRHFDGSPNDAKFIGDVVMAYNAGRKGTVITHAGIRGRGNAIYNPHGIVGRYSATDEASTLPVPLGPGEAVSFPFSYPLGDPIEAFREERGYELTYFSPRRIYRWKSYPMRKWPGYDRFGWKIYVPWIWARSKTKRVKFSGTKP